MIKVLTKRENTILYATVGVLIFATLFNFAIAPILTKNDNLNREINLSREKLKKYLWLLSQKEIIQKKYSKYAPTTSITGHEQDAVVSALSELESLAKNAGIKIIDLRPQARETKGTELYKEILIDLRTEGSMEGYLKFIYNLENSLSLLRIKRFQLTAKPNAQVLEGSFSISQLSGLE